MGVGDEKASVLSATFVWLVKDGVGMLGRILFAWHHGTGNYYFGGHVKLKYFDFRS